LPPFIELGLAVPAHPARYKRSFRTRSAVAELGIDGIETYYAYNNPNPGNPAQQTKQMQELAAIYGTLNTCVALIPRPQLASAPLKMSLRRHLLMLVNVLDV